MGKVSKLGFERGLTMALVGRRDGRNFGYGRQLSYAGPQALQAMFGGGHYGTVKAHADRWQAFVRWCRSDDDRGLMMHGRSTNRPCWITPDIFVSTLNKANSPSPPRKTDYPA